MSSGKSPEELDHTPLTFGKYRGMTPSELGEVDPQYVCWMFETVKDKNTCSALLYKDCVGKKSPKIKSYKKPQDAYVSPKIKDHFDSYSDMDDDIPF